MTARLKILVLSLLLVALIGFVVPYAMDNGIARFRRDPVQYRVAMAGLQDFWALNRGGVSSLITPRARVTRVWEDKGHCHDPRAGGETSDYRAEVRGISWFALPGLTLDVSCGGLQWRRRK
jgi:hypothetical protein